MSPLQSKIEEKIEEQKEQLREYFDKTLKAKKPTMKNLDREILVDFHVNSIRTILTTVVEGMGEDEDDKCVCGIGEPNCLGQCSGGINNERARLRSLITQALTSNNEK